jgi:hypothetical protein
MSYNRFHRYSNIGSFEISFMICHVSMTRHGKDDLPSGHQAINVLSDTSLPVLPSDRCPPVFPNRVILVVCPLSALCTSARLPVDKTYPSLPPFQEVTPSPLSRHLQVCTPVEELLSSKARSLKSYAIDIASDQGLLRMVGRGYDASSIPRHVSAHGYAGTSALLQSE